VSGTSVIVALLLVLIANGAPVLARHVPVLSRIAYPLDGHHLFVDGRPFLGATKTWRGVFAAVVLTVPAALLFGLSAKNGLVVALLAMAGDSLSSFIKRRLGIGNSAMALGLDQIPESLLPLLYLHFVLDLGWRGVGVVVVLFLVLELVLSRWLFRLSIRKRPY
jgi:CDP-2,3-bis-(O-geranylgeranyl)-sn-glycerol synthase